MKENPKTTTYHYRRAPAYQFFSCAFYSELPGPPQRKPGSGKEHCDPARSLHDPSHGPPSENTLWPEVRLEVERVRLEP